MQQRWLRGPKMHTHNTFNLCTEPTGRFVLVLDFFVILYLWQWGLFAFLRWSYNSSHSTKMPYFRLYALAVSNSILSISIAILVTTHNTILHLLNFENICDWQNTFDWFLYVLRCFHWGRWQPTMCKALQREGDRPANSEPKNYNISHSIDCICGVRIGGKAKWQS